jgi:hypothetical protein
MGWGAVDLAIIGCWVIGAGSLQSESAKMIDAAANELPALARLAAPGIEAVRRFWKSFLLIQSCALMLVLAYFHSSNVQSVCEKLARLQQSGGLLLSAVAAGIAGGIVPEIAKAILPPKLIPGEKRGHHLTRGDLTFAIIAFAINGLITDLQYRLLGWAIGRDAHFLTAVKKMLADQFITTPIYGIVYWAVIYRWKALGFRIGPLLREMGPHWYLTQVMPLLIPCWCFWIPMVLMVYLMPAPLQFSLFCLALAAWSLLMVFVANDSAQVNGLVA